MALMVDANQGYSRAQAVEFGRLVSDIEVRWFEEYRTMLDRPSIRYRISA